MGIDCMGLSEDAVMPAGVVLFDHNLTVDNNMNMLKWPAQGDPDSPLLGTQHYSLRNQNFQFEYAGYGVNGLRATFTYGYRLIDRDRAVAPPSKTRPSYQWNGSFNVNFALAINRADGSLVTEIVSAKNYHGNWTISSNHSIVTGPSGDGRIIPIKFLAIYAPFYHLEEESPFYLSPFFSTSVRANSIGMTAELINTQTVEVYQPFRAEELDLLAVTSSYWGQFIGHDPLYPSTTLKYQNRVFSDVYVRLESL
jgi:hypothetical protein